MAANPYAGTLGHLTREEEEKLQVAWIHLMRLCGEENVHKYVDGLPLVDVGSGGPINGVPHVDATSPDSDTDRSSVGAGPLSSCPVDMPIKEAGAVNGVSDTNGHSQTNGTVEANGGPVNGSAVNGVNGPDGIPKTNGAAEKANGNAINGTAVNGDELKVDFAGLKIKSVEDYLEETRQRVPDKTEVFRKLLTNKSPDHFRRRLWEAVKADNPDALVLRFLRARKWDIEKSISMLVSAVNWRSDMRLQEDVVIVGESVALKDAPTKDDKDFLEQYRSGKSFVRGTDNNHHPVYVVKVKLHNPNAQSSKCMENYVLHNIESIRLLVREPNDKATLIFDLSGFGLKNMDFHVVKFILEVFEARYPETLALVLVHNAPFVFWGIWNIIKGWLDPVIASKIHFTRGNDMRKFIPKDKLQKCYGGDDTFEYKYTEPKTGENDEMYNAEKKDEIQKERDALAYDFERATVFWAVSDPTSQEAKNINAKRMDTAGRLRENYWRIDPYVRARTHYDRIGALKDTKAVNFDFGP